jgi:hypothetical protein
VPRGQGPCASSEIRRPGTGESRVSPGPLAPETSTLRFGSIHHSLPKPCAHLDRAMLLPALKLSLNGFQLRDRSPLRRNPPDDESFVAVALPTEVGETQERESIWFPFFLHAVSCRGRQTA